MFGFAPFTYIDLLAIIGIPIISTVYTIFVFGYKESKNSFRIPFCKSVTQNELKISENFFRTYGESIIVISVLCCLLSAIDMFVKFDDKIEIGPRLAFSLLCILYGAFIYM
jgi:hypothetical protein